MAKAAEHGLRTTPGTFQMAGIVSGTNKPSFYTEKTFGNGNQMKSVNFTVKYDTDKALYPVVQGFTRSDVYFSKKNKETNKTETKKVPWAQRMIFAEQNPGWSIIGCNIGLVKGEDGKNIKKHITEYDAAQYIKENLKDDMSVFVRGNLDFRSYTDKNGEVKRIRTLNATQVSLCSDIDFNSETFSPNHEWTQEIVYTGIEKETDDNGKPTDRFIVSGYVVSFNSIEPVSFIMVDKTKASLVKKNLKPYSAITLNGVIEVTNNIDEVDSVDEWGQPIPQNKRVNGRTITEMIVTYPDPKTIDADSFSEESVAAGIKKLKAKEKVAQNFGENKEEVSTAESDAVNGWDDNASLNDEDPW